MPLRFARRNDKRKKSDAGIDLDNPARFASSKSQRIFFLFAASEKICGTFVLVLKTVPFCAKHLFFCLSQFEKCSYSEKAQRFLGDNYLN